MRGERVASESEGGVMELTSVEARVLGCLVEKERTTPQQYPLSEAGVLAACNQATNRDPVVRYDQSAVRLALRSLREEGLARTMHRPGDRTEKHRHLLAEALELDDGAIAVLAGLLLRGPQTAAELRARVDRLHPFEDTAAVEAALQALATRPGGALVQRLERQPGQGQARWTDLVAADRDAGLIPPDGADGANGADESGGLVERARTPVAALAEDVAALRAEVAELRAVVAGLSGDRGASREDGAA